MDTSCWLVIIVVFKVSVVIIDEIPDKTDHIVICPVQPVFDRRLYVKDGPAVKSSWVHLADLILVAMIATTIHTSEDEGVGV